ncbi:Ldh family oxidoreductase (plasmid) [Rhizobium leguminosarum]|jgi:L-lactate dehydrogenase|uniref:Lactate dehydrogenase n=2 Tax=Rhizobium leguminosarum TaxID=384 RepID=A0A1B8RD60_RHILT|nr:Ldh family oxidoreductase [Rhizobium leguminosarum]AOO90470.1 lactate dehydrogenase [Rhizobium leguminosarum bv. trifolii]ASS58680.1 lactate dehydrogenase [Rhizobium leguminosarum bv. viciae]AXA42474.1 Malate/L-lactate dehydrogenase family protein [Rhizobium leguminosarum]MBB4330554.1 L-lactate dehydrogenase [Rhizobium leguminosarum]MBB4339581.1 L-lactate dehydrogenase [Rhizobium leguminosarum]
MPLIDRIALTQFAEQILTRAGMEPDKAETTAAVLVEGDMIGHETHGVSLLNWYVEALEDGSLAKSGSYEVVNDRGAAFVWDGKSLPGAWLLTKAIDQVCERVGDYGVVTAAIRNCHHTCALSAFMRQVTERGLIVQLSVSHPAASRVAPYGGTKPLLTPNPMAAGFPTSADPILIDVSASITTTTMTQNLAKAGKKFPEAWAFTAAGEPTDDPREVTERGGTMMPLGGQLKGHKGFGLGLIVELLGQGLSGKGRANAPAGVFSQSAFLQVIDPAFFAGLDAFTAQSDFLASACRSNPPAPWNNGPVRMPGDSAAGKRRLALEQGVPVGDAPWQKLCKHAEILGLPIPDVTACP